MNSAFVIWKDPETTMWEPVAKLTELNGLYKFSYTRGALNERFVAFPRMDILTKEYVSSQLFPFFQNRLIPERRPEYFTMLSWLDMGGASNDPLEILSASGGSKKTDNFRVVKAPVPTADGEYRLKFFVSGVAYVSDEVKQELLSLQRGMQLSWEVEDGNLADPSAISIVNKNTNKKYGYYPHYLNEDLIYLSRLNDDVGGSSKARISVIKVNYSAPEQYRLLCECIATWPKKFVPFQSDKYKLIV